MSADVLDSVQDLIRQANMEAETMDGIVHLYSRDLDRAMAFVPSVEPLRAGETRYIDPSRNVPEDAVLETWTDRYRLAQELHYRYSDPEVVEVSELAVEPYFEARVELTCTVARRGFQSTEIQLAPEAPECFVVWQNPWTKYGNRRGGDSIFTEHQLPALRVIGQPVDDTNGLDPLALSALQSLEHDEFEVARCPVKLHFAYDLARKKWQLQRASVSGVQPIFIDLVPALNWKPGDYVFNPGEHGTRKSE